MIDQEAPISIIGIDCAVDPRRVGLAAARLCAGSPSTSSQVTNGREGGRLTGIELFAPSTTRELTDWIAERIDGPTLLAIDAPLGWPAALGSRLAVHRAGRPVGADPNLLFRRLTDRVVREQIGKQPLEVGADRIARTAVAALDLIGRLEAARGVPIGLAWNPADLVETAAIETYPAAWLTTRGLPASRYKEAAGEARARRREIIAAVELLLGEPLSPEAIDALAGSSHLLDGLICVLCGVDFLNGRCLAPESAQVQLAAQEGWIWISRAR